MSYEFSATLTSPTPGAGWNAVAEALKRVFAKQVVFATEGRASLSFDPPPESAPTLPEANWGADVDLMLTGNEFHVAFHSATSAQREQVLAVVAEALAQSGSPVEFEEQ